MKEAKGGAKPSTSTKRRLAGTTGMRTQLEPPKTKQLKLVLAPSVRILKISLISNLVMRIFKFGRLLRNSERLTGNLWLMIDWIIYRTISRRRRGTRIQPLWWWILAKQLLRLAPHRLALLIADPCDLLPAQIRSLHSAPPIRITVWCWGVLRQRSLSPCLLIAPLHHSLVLSLQLSLHPS